MDNVKKDKSIIMTFRVTSKEKQIIEKRALQTNTNSTSAYTLFYKKRN